MIAGNMAGKRRGEIRDAGATMQVDALVDELEDLGPPSNFGPAPPPLPPKKASKLVWVVGALVVLLAAALGIGAGIYILGGETPPPVTQAPQEIARPAAAPPAAEPTAAEPAPAEPAHDVVQMDEVVFGADEPAPAAE